MKFAGPIQTQQKLITGLTENIFDLDLCHCSCVLLIESFVQVQDTINAFILESRLST